jgi:hypothetical protein
MSQFSEILCSTSIENKSIRFAIVENLYKNLFLTLNSRNWWVNVSQNRPPEVVMPSAKFEVKNSIERNSCRYLQEESNHHKNMGFCNYCSSDVVPTRSYAPPRVEKLNPKSWVRHGFVALNWLYL